MTRTALLLAGLLALTGCGASPGLVFLGGNLVTLIHDDKTIIDYGVSAQRKEDCSLVHASNGEPYCQPWNPPGPREAVATMATTHYCYRTLGGVSCYDRPDYAASGQTRVDFAYGVSPATTPVPMAALPNLR